MFGRFLSSMNNKYFIALQAVISILIIGGTIAMILTKTPIPEWWPPLAVSVVAFLFGVRNGQYGRTSSP